MMKPAKYLVINADDFGYCDNRNRGVVECFQNGVVSSATLMVTGSARVKAVEMAEKAKLPLGLHFNISEGLPVHKQFSSLTDKNGKFLGKYGIREQLAAGLIDLDDVRSELDAQIKCFIELTGRDPTHVDGHQHVHVLTGISEVFSEVLQCWNIRWTRIPNETDIGLWVDNNSSLSFFNDVANDARASAEVFHKYNIRSTDYFIGKSLMGDWMTVDRIIDKLKRLFSIHTIDKGSISCELMVHPGYVVRDDSAGCGVGPDVFSQSQAREHEIKVLTDPSLKQYLIDYNIKLCSFATLNP